MHPESRLVPSDLEPQELVAATNCRKSAHLRRQSVFGAFQDCLLLILFYSIDYAIFDSCFSFAQLATATYHGRKQKNERDHSISKTSLVGTRWPPKPVICKPTCWQGLPKLRTPSWTGDRDPRHRARPTPSLRWPAAALANPRHRRVEGVPGRPGCQANAAPGFVN